MNKEYMLKIRSSSVSLMQSMALIGRTLSEEIKRTCADRWIK